MIDDHDVNICIGSQGAGPDSQGAVLPPIAQASLFRKQSAKELHEALRREDEEFVYTRGTNPTVKILEDRLAALERGEACKCFGSGIAAISAVFTGLLESGDHILFINNIYGPTIHLAEMLESFGIEQCRLIVVAKDRQLTILDDFVQAKERVGTIADDVAEADNFINVAFADSFQHGI